MCVVPGLDIGVDGLHDDPVGVGPVVAQALPGAPPTLGDLRVTWALVVDLELIVGAVFEDLRPARAEVGERCDELRGRRFGRLVEVDRGHGVLLDWVSMLALPGAAGGHAMSAPSDIASAVSREPDWTTALYEKRYFRFRVPPGKPLAQVASKTGA